VAGVVKILVLSFYYEPDLSACSFRTTALVQSLVEALPLDTEIDVITTLPNRYSTFTVEVPAEERHGAVRIRRIALPSHKSGMRDQSRAYIVFARAAARLAKAERYSLVYATSSRLMTAVLGSWIARRQRAPLYLDIRDIFVETMLDVLPRPLALATMPAIERLERYAVSRADKVNLVSEGFAPYFRQRYPRQDFSFHTNGIDDEFIGFAAGASGDGATHGPRTVVYAGNIGEGQGLHAVLPELAKRTSGRLRFRVIGAGGRLRELESRIAAEGLTNIELVPPMNREALMKEYRSADILFLHLNDYEAFKRVLPSKVFEYAATGKPIWAGVGGYSAEFLKAHVENAAVFAPCDVAGALDAFSRLRFESTPRAAFIERFSRRTISAALAADLLATRGKR
jgi:glycosyltransferase involved in cell wall biosynthesis